MMIWVSAQYDIVVITHEMEILNAACYGLIPGD